MTDFSQSGCGGKRSNSDITLLRSFISHPSRIMNLPGNKNMRIPQLKVTEMRMQINLQYLKH